MGVRCGIMVAPRMARSFHEALGISFASADPQKYVDVLLYGLTLAWGAEVTSFDLPPDAAAVSFAICDQVTQEVQKVPQKRQTTTLAEPRSTPKKGGASGGSIPMQVDDGNIGAGGGDAGGGTEAVEGAGDVAQEEDEEMTHKRPSYRNGWPGDFHRGHFQRENAIFHVGATIFPTIVFWQFGVQGVVCYIVP